MTNEERVANMRNWRAYTKAFPNRYRIGIYKRNSLIIITLEEKVFARSHRKDPFWLGTNGYGILEEDWDIVEQSPPWSMDEKKEVKLTY